jgi:hypothetical protein
MKRPSGTVLAWLWAALLLEAASRGTLSIEAMRTRILGNDATSYRIAWIHRGALPGVAYIFDEYHPIRGWTLRPGIRDAIVFGDRILNTNAKGLRGVAEYDYARQEGEKRVLVLGDSFTFGEEVSDDETYPAILSALLPRTDVLNMGEHGYGHDQMTLYFEEEGEKYRPDLVVLGFLPLDMERNTMDFRDFAKPLFRLEAAGGLRLTHTPVPTAEEVRAREPYRSRFVDLVAMLFERFRAVSGSAEREERRVTAAILGRLRDDVRRVGARLLLAYLPAWHELEPGGETGGEDFFREVCRGEGFECVDLRPSFQDAVAHGDHFKTSGHWNRREHRKAAELLAPRIAALLAGPKAPPPPRPSR